MDAIAPPGPLDDPGVWWLRILATEMPTDLILHLLFFLQMNLALEVVGSSARLRRELGSAVKKIMFDRVSAREHSHHFRPLEMKRVSLQALRHELLNFLRFTSHEFMTADRLTLFPSREIRYTCETLFQTILIAGCQFLILQVFRLGIIPFTRTC